ncbi:MAG: terminase small subunit [Muribaculaceae bacterium]|nr:terminase small subunit [Muribaculaceae bacterium]
MAKTSKSNSKSKERRLTEKQEKFCQYYIDTGNASEAYRMSYDTSKMQPATINRSAIELRDNPKIAARLDEIRAERAAASAVERKTVEKVLMDIITSSPNDLYTEDPKSGKIKMKSPNQLPQRVGNALKKIKNNRGVVEYEFNSKIEAARLLGSWNGWDAPTQLNVNNTNNVLGELRIGFDDDYDV